ncbi:hypothetical protein [Saccharothrix variisporea]|uniref:PPE family protein n=1 Tax=Saccharothrix variisporea TaxID=543527 RepID=A0A495XLN1_9PSEU|nr:hypothetical protein [Saccharothrix variisporea]RKT73794.1 hypothetical protein DFJ66_7131 [Saccharothrix variisporea]
MADYRGLGFDPTPGDAEAVAAVSERCAAVVDVPAVPPGWSGAESAGAESAGAADAAASAGWAGVAAEGFAARWEAVVSEVAAVRRAMRAAADVLDAWATEVLGNRRRAEELDARAVRLRRELADAADEVDHTGALATFTPTHGELHAAAVARHDDLARRLAEVLAEARLLERDHHAAARRVAERLRDTEAVGPAPGEASDGCGEALVGFSAVTEEMASVLFGARPPAPGSIVPPGADSAGREGAGSAGIGRGGAAAFGAGLG